jgi:Ni,Fe-hydrogenase III component G
MTTATDALTTAEALLAPFGGTAVRPEPNRLDLTLPAAALVPAASALAASQWGYLSTLTGLDLGPQAGQLEVLYHFCAASAVMTLRVSVPRSAATLPSLAAVMPAVALHEREVGEMLGVTFTGSPSSARLYLPDDWPSDVFPLRKDAQLE